MKMVVQHYRVPEFPFLLLPNKGKPHMAFLYPYSRIFGFIDFDSNIKPSTRGGATVVCLLDQVDNSDWISSGGTVCSMSDNFSYKTGRELALSNQSWVRTY